MHRKAMKPPKNEGRCIHCRETPSKLTKDHVFPASWYPESTRKEVQRWTAPSCLPCNGKFGAIEKELLEFFAVCIDPSKPAAKGLYARVRRSMGIGVEGIDDGEKTVREALRRKFLKKAEPYSPEAEKHTLPGVGRHVGFPDSMQWQTFVEEEKIHQVAKKIVRGCEYWLGNGRIVDPPHEIEVIFARETTPFVAAVMARFAVVTRDLEPGLAIRRAVAQDDALSSLYELRLWDTTTVYATILPRDSDDPNAVHAHEATAVHAYYHWERRGRPEGSPEIDWYWAVQDLKRR
jgi:Protein of unknown function (DUF2934)